MRMVIDVTIVTDNFTALVNTSIKISAAHPNIVKYMAMIGVFPRTKDTIEIDMIINKEKHRINCYIDRNSDRETPITLGLEALFQTGFIFSQSDTSLSKYRRVSQVPTNKSSINAICDGENAINVTVFQNTIIKDAFMQPEREIIDAVAEGNLINFTDDNMEEAADVLDIHLDADEADFITSS